MYLSLLKSVCQTDRCTDLLSQQVFHDSVITAQVYVEPLARPDLEFITSSLFPRLPSPLLQGMVHFTLRLAAECGSIFAQRGAPWELNLRDITRWAQAMGDPPHPERWVGIIYADRMRTASDKQRVSLV